MPDLTRRRLLATAATLPTLGAALGVAPAGAAPAPAAIPQVAAATPAPVPADLAPRERLRMNEGWRFHLGHAADPLQDFGFGTDRSTYAKSGDLSAPVAKADFDDKDWAAVTLPHDWAVDLPFTQARLPGKEAAEAMAYQGFKPLGRQFPETSVGWYRRSFTLPATDAGRRLSLEFDGVARNCLVVLNGFIVATNESGYAPFRVDITDFVLLGGANTLVIRVDATLGEAWSYEGAGLYRHVWLVKTAPAHVPQWGTFVRSTVTPGSADLTITTELANEGPAAEIKVRSTVLAPDGTAALRLDATPLALGEWDTGAVVQTATLASPALWSLEAPKLYTLVTEVSVGGAVIDRYHTSFGIRTLRFDANEGFFLNGRPVKVKGTCNHQDHAGVGFAVPDRLHAYRVERLKEMGANAWRTTHHPPAPALLDACDRLGILVMEETRQMSSNPEGMSQLERMVRRDRNRPSVFLWSIGNEEIHRGTEQGARIAASMKRAVYRLDGTRPVTEAFNGKFGQGASPVLDVMGFNYYLDEIDAFHARFPNQPMIGTETASTVCTRGVYAHDDARHYVPAYDTEYPKWASTAEQWWTFYDSRPFLSGGFAWTGFDYRGEPTPFIDWPNTVSNFGILDLCGFPKDNYHYYRAWWRPDQPHLHLFPHWTWPGREGQDIAVWCHSNLDAVELFVNGRSLGRKDVTRNRHLEWTVPYQPGAIEAHGYKDGRRVLTQRQETAGPAHALTLTADRVTLRADGDDVAVLSASVVDAKGRLVPDADHLVTFTIEGGARLLGVGNGDPTSLEPDHAPYRKAFKGLCGAIVQTGKQAGTVRVTAKAEGLKAATVELSLEKAALVASVGLA
ncbi:beta-galactosidase [Nitrospirillum amazonense]|uniref:Beta-galactosidase n=1 Tax=Nitrospirillum amazonense TaxID=28077 RepID=A0A560FK67_9PROT|nr:beta-galactosidase GalA [Nitrospirillum amazonense]TWB22002.1 beta-galactosidase [Nitrospirillum amazonense]